MAMLAVAAIVAGFLMLIAAQAPRAVVATWFVAAVAVPYWAYVHTGAYDAPVLDILSLLAIGAIVLGRRKVALPRPSAAVLVFVAVAIVGGLVGGMPAWYPRTIVLSWLLPCYLGQLVVVRIGTQWLTTVLRRVGLLLAAISMLEFVTRVHPFTSIAQGSPVAFWSEIQARGSFDRSELTFGHSIALGGTIALLTPFVVGSAKENRRVPYTLIVVAGVACTLSRGALMATAVALVLMVIFRTDASQRRRQQVVALILVALVAVPLVVPVFRDAGVELQQSTDIRSSFFTDLRDQVEVLGTSHTVTFTDSRAPLFDGYRSIDNAYLLIALESGVLALLAFGWVLGGPVLSVLRRRGSLADFAVVSMVPILATVAFITQWQSLVFLLIGAAHSWPRSSGRPDFEMAAVVGEDVEAGNGSAA